MKVRGEPTTIAMKLIRYATRVTALEALFEPHHARQYGAIRFEIIRSMGRVVPQPLPFEFGNGFTYACGT